ncbi:hypothetical protein D9758_007868 [Tetrapyrgos nigripes]|uniref:Amidase domain-containing protein n=1 Tax=Tetrapyrgos nigripes TaxID=182062 RepID=A0A8H5FX26_9AGAR|nr:hypothetical protein D9758_007868 [Tetrapyrgos nigripes]
MSLPSLSVSLDNPVDDSHLDSVLAKLGHTLKAEERADYLALLKAFHETISAVKDLPDYVPPTDLRRFPRENLHFPKAEENDLGAWAWKFTAKDTQPNEGILVGKTIVMKDNISVAQVHCLLGTDAVTDFIPTSDATVVTRSLMAGATIVGKAVCENFSMTGTSFSAATGPVHNPYARGYSAGGSSSGCGALVASGAVDILNRGVGGDQGGSIRLPASWCGIYGMKPTQGLVPYTGIASLESTLDHTGPMTRTALDNAILLKALAGNDNIDDRCRATPPPSQIPNYPSVLDEVKKSTKPLQGFKIGLLKEGFHDMPSGLNDPRVAMKVREAAEKFKDLGAVVEEVSVPQHSMSMPLWLCVVRMGCVPGFMGGKVGRQGFYDELLTIKMGNLHTAEGWEKTPWAAKNMIMNGVYMQSYCPELYGKATNLIRRLREQYDEALSKYDVLVMPTVPYLPTPHAPLNATVVQKIEKGLGQTANTCSFDVTGHPALTMPIGMLEAREDKNIKFPVGLQIVGKHFDESTIYKAAFAWEDRFSWKEC